MSKNDFDVNFDFEDDFSFDSKQFLGAEDFNTEVDLDSFSDETAVISAYRFEDKAGKPERITVDIRLTAG